MNTQSLLVAMLAAAFAGGAFATSKSPAELQQEAQLRAPSTITRAEVIAQMYEAGANGTLNVHPDYGTRAVTISSQLTRTAVLNQVNEARANGTLNVHPDYGQPVARTRATVRAEIAVAMARGERLSQGDANRNSPSVHKPHAEDRSAATPRDAVAGK